MPPLNDDELRGTVEIRKRIKRWLREHGDRDQLIEFAVKHIRPKFDGEDPYGTAAAHLRRLLDQDKGWTQMNLDRWTKVLDKWDGQAEQETSALAVVEAAPPPPPSDLELAADRGDVLATRAEALEAEVVELRERLASNDTLDEMRRRYVEGLLDVASQTPTPALLDRIERLLFAPAISIDLSGLDQAFASLTEAARATEATAA